MRKINYITLEKKIIAEIIKIYPKKKFHLEAPLFYEGQIPIAAYLLIDGCIQLFKNNKQKKTIKAGSLIGFNELMNNSAVELSAKAQADSTICFLDKSTIQEIMLTKNSELADILNGVETK